MALVKDKGIVVSSLYEDVSHSALATKRLKLRTLLSKFGYKKRSIQNTTNITHLLTTAGLTLNPPILPFDDNWMLSLDDWIYLSVHTQALSLTSSPISSWKKDSWFGCLADLELRNEKEVETKFIAPLLTRLGYQDIDRHDGVSVPASFGTRSTRLVIDFVLYNNSSESLRGQPLLIVEAKREGRLIKQKEIINARDQAKSYCYWRPCDFFMVTDGRTLQVYRTWNLQYGNSTPLYECKRDDLSTNFHHLYAYISKEALTHHYLSKFRTIEEMQ